MSDHTAIGANAARHLTTGADNTMVRARRVRARRVPHVSDLMFRDTITARTLRTLCDQGAMAQSVFMNLYHQRCDRPREDSRSSFSNNFERFVRLELTYRGWVERTGPYRCIKQTRALYDDTGERVPYNPETVNMLAWNYRDGCNVPCATTALIASMTNDQLTRAEQFLERETTTRTYNSTTKHFYSVDDEHETRRWLLAVRAAMKGS